MSIGKRLLAFRQQQGLSQQELADYLHVSRQTVSKWESDLSLPDMKTALSIAEFYNITINELLGLEEIEKSPHPTKRTNEFYKKRPCSELVYDAALMVEKYIEQNK